MHCKERLLCPCKSLVYEDFARKQCIPCFICVCIHSSISLSVHPSDQSCINSCGCSPVFTCFTQRLLCSRAASQRQAAKCLNLCNECAGFKATAGPGRRPSPQLQDMATNHTASGQHAHVVQTQPTWGAAAGQQQRQASAADPQQHLANAAGPQQGLAAAADQQHHLGAAAWQQQRVPNVPNSQQQQQQAGATYSPWLLAAAAAADAIQHAALAAEAAGKPPKQYTSKGMTPRMTHSLPCLSPVPSLGVSTAVIDPVVDVDMLSVVFWKSCYRMTQNDFGHQNRCPWQLYIVVTQRSTCVKPFTH